VINVHVFYQIYYTKKHLELHVPSNSKNVKQFKNPARRNNAVTILLINYALVL